MTDTVPTLSPQPVQSAAPELFHWVCECDWDLALCGLDVGGHRVGSPHEDPVCIVCDYLLHAPCPRCGSVA